ncbi:MAG: hypothetical protein Q8L48_34735 [Archangium sp.]|nr:hypothetical protein [Archangium sp.]
MTGASKAALVAAATRECSQQTASPSCERVLVVYAPRLRSGQALSANIYIESAPSPRPAGRRSA